MAKHSSSDASASARVANLRGADEFKSARRHSLLVRMLRKILPAAAIVSSLSFVALAAVSYVPVGDVSVGGASLRDGRLVMETPKMAGFDAKGQPYDVKALRALQDLSKPDIIELQKINANIPMDKKNIAKLTADEGTYDSEAETLQLRKNIVIKGVRGMDIDLESADIDVRTGALKSTMPVRVVSSTSEVSAKSVEVQDSGKRIIFRDQVRVTIRQPVERGVATPKTAEHKDVSQ
ncbi:MAG: LPS export ABC transporter periplasmic protein LptC [Rhizobiaceae bacterium]